MLVVKLYFSLFFSLSLFFFKATNCVVMVPHFFGLVCLAHISVCVCPSKIYIFFGKFGRVTGTISIGFITEIHTNTEMSLLHFTAWQKRNTRNMTSSFDRNQHTRIEKATQNTITTPAVPNDTCLNKISHKILKEIRITLTRESV